MTYTIPKKIMGFFFALCMVASNFTMPIHAEETKNYNDFGKVEIQDSNGNSITSDTEAKTSDVFTMKINDVQFNDDDIKITVPDELLLVTDAAEIKDSDIEISNTSNEITITKPEEEEATEEEVSINNNESTDVTSESESINEEEYTDDNSESDETNDGEVYEQKLIRKNNEEDTSNQTYTVEVPFYVTKDAKLDLNDPDKSDEDNEVDFTYKEETTDIKGQIKFENDQKKDRPSEVKVTLMNGEDEVKSVEAKKSKDYKFDFKKMPVYDENISKNDYTLNIPNEVKGYTVTNNNPNTNTITLTGESTGGEEGSTGGSESSESKTDTFTITTTAGEGGSIDQNATVKAGDSATISYKANDGYEVDKVIVDGTEVDDKDGSYEFSNVNETHSIDVTFKKKEETAEIYTITTKAGPNGSIDASTTVDEGNDVTIRYQADTGYEIDTVKVDGQTQSYAYGYYIFDHVKGNHSIEVTFKKAKQGVRTVQLVKDSTSITSAYKAGQILSTVNWSIQLNDDGEKNQNSTDVIVAFGFEDGGSKVTLDPTSTSWLSHYYTISEDGYTVVIGSIKIKDFSKFNDDGILNGSGTIAFNAKSSSTAYTVQPEAIVFVNESAYVYDDVLSNAVTVPALSKKQVVETTTITGTKTWDDNNNAAKKRPDSIIVYLYYGKGKDDRIARVITGTGNTWKYTFTGLPKYDSNGKEIEYSIREQALSYYDGTVRGYDLTNTYNGKARKGTVTVNTGTETNTGLYVGLLCAAAAVIVVIVVMRKKSAK